MNREDTHNVVFGTNDMAPITSSNWIDHQSFAIPPPPLSVAESYDALISKVNSHGVTHGYAVRKFGTNKHTNPDGTKGAYRNGYIVCDRQGKHSDSHAYMNAASGAGGRKRKGKDNQPAMFFSRRTNCKFKLYCSPDVNGTWTWDTKLSSYAHNHGPSAGPESHAIHRGLSVEQKNAAVTAIQCGAQPSKVWESMEAQHRREGKPFHVNKQDIYNLKSKIAEVQRRGTTDAQSVFEHLREQLIPFRARVDSQKRLESLFLAEPMSIALARKYGYALQIDSTFKTNPYGMPLLHIVSSTPANKTFTLALAFLGGKEEHCVIWALTHFRDIMGELPTQVVVTDEATAIRNAITIVFKDWRQILCRWHLANTVKKACNDHEATREEEDVVIKQFLAIASSTSAEQFQQLRDEMILHWARADSSDPNHVGPMEHVCSFVLRKLELAPHFVSYHLADGTS